MTKPRARDLGIPFDGNTGAFNAITDVSGVTVGYATVIEGHSARTGVTIIHPRGKGDHTPVYAGVHSFNGNGEMTGAAWIEEGGLLEGPIGITNSHSVGIVRDTIIAWQLKNNAMYQRWSLEGTSRDESFGFGKERCNRRRKHRRRDRNGLL